MQLAKSYWCAESVLSVDACDRIIELGDSLKQRESRIPQDDPDREIRRSKNAWLRGSRDNKKFDWIYDRLTQHVLQMNQRLWRWNLHRFEPFQYTIYTDSDHYTWHADQKCEPYGVDTSYSGLTRKLTVSVQLSDPNDYQGGDFELELLGYGPDSASKRIVRPGKLRNKGAAVVFPSFLFHRVTKVTKGTRKSLVGWCLGPPFY